MILVGEIGILFDVERTATVVAKSSCTLVSLTSEDVHDALVSYPEIKEIMRRSAKERLRVITDQLERAGRKMNADSFKKFQSIVLTPVRFFWYYLHVDVCRTLTSFLM